MGQYEQRGDKIAIVVTANKPEQKYCIAVFGEFLPLFKTTLTKQRWHYKSR
jgi:hypothetical protein